MEVSDYGGVRSNPTPPPMKGELLMYVEKTDTYTCDFCGHNAKWDASDDVHGELWSCEAEGCGKFFLLQVLHQRVWTGNLHDHDAERRKRPLPGMCEEKVQKGE